VSDPWAAERLGTGPAARDHSRDGAGQLLVEFAIARSVLVGDRPEPVPLRVSGSFELDPGTLGEILAGFEQLVRAVAA
jgi:hypothetical protein